MKTKSALLAKLILLSATLTGQCAASIVTFDFTGRFNATGSILPGNFGAAVLEQTIEGSFSFQSNAQGTSGGTGLEEYSLTSLSATVGTYTFMGGAASDILVIHAPGVLGRDGYEVGSTDPIGPSVSGYNLQAALIDLMGPYNSVFHSTALPLTPPALASFTDQAALGLAFTGANGRVAVLDYSISSLTLATPEPATFGLFAGSSVALFFLTRARRRLA